MEQNSRIIEPDNTAVRIALWRALHVQVDAKPYILEDEMGLKLVAPDDSWRRRLDMNVDFTRRMRASIVARARLIEDLVVEQSKQGLCQYVILGAGLDTFAQRRTDIASNLQIYEIDQPDTLAWKQQRLIELGLGVPEYLHYVPVNFEASSWWNSLLKAGFDTKQPAVVACTGVSVYLTKEAITSTLNQVATLASGSKLAMTFSLPIELLDEEDKPLQELAKKGTREAGTPMVSYFTPDEILTLANRAGFKEVTTKSTKDIQQYYFTNRADNLLPASGDIYLLATT